MEKWNIENKLQAMVDKYNWELKSIWKMPSYFNAAMTGYFYWKKAKDGKKITIYLGLEYDLVAAIKAQAFENISFGVGCIYINQKFDQYDKLIDIIDESMARLNQDEFIDLQSRLIEVFEKDGWVNSQKYGISYYYENDKHWIGFMQNKTFFSIYLADCFPLLDEFKALNDPHLGFTKSALQVKDFSRSKAIILQKIVEQFIKK